MADQGRDVLRPLPQGRHRDGDHVEAEVQVLAEVALLDLDLQLLVRGGDDAHVHVDRLLGADALHLALLQHAQHLGLRAQAHVPDLVQEDGALVRQLELPDLLLGGPRERALLVPEQLALDELLGDGRAVDLHEGLVAPQAVAVDGPRDQLLAHPALARDEHGGVGGGGAPHRVPHLLQGRALPLHPVALVEAELEAPVLLRELALAERVARHEQQALAVGRLLDEVVGAELGGLHGRGHRAVPGEDHHRGRGLLGLEGLQDLHAVHLRHLDVEEDEVRRLPLDHLEGGLAVGGQQALVPFVLEDHAQRGADGLLVVDHEDLGLRAHRRARAFSTAAFFSAFSGRFSTSTLARKLPSGRGR